jgi:hypothetical protein
LYSGTNNGSRLSEQTEKGAGIEQQYSSREGADIPELIAGWAYGHLATLAYLRP